MPRILSSDGVLCNFTAPDFQVFEPGTSQPAGVLSTIAPTTVVHGVAATTLTLTGTGFKNGAVAKAGATVLVTTYVSATQVTAVVPAAALVPIGTLSVTVVNQDAPASGASTLTVT